MKPKEDMTLKQLIREMQRILKEREQGNKKPIQAKKKQGNSN
jgi:hypothetical protein